METTQIKRGRGRPVGSVNRVPRPPGLSPRECEVLRHVAGGLTNRRIADTLFIESGTVKSHIEHILTKLGVANRIQAVVWAVRNGLLEMLETKEGSQ